MSSTMSDEGAIRDADPARTLGAALLDVVREAAERSAFRLWCRLLDVSAIDLTTDPWKDRVEPRVLVDVLEELRRAVLVFDRAYAQLSIAYFEIVGPDGPPDVPAAPPTITSARSTG